MRTIKFRAWPLDLNKPQKMMNVRLDTILDENDRCENDIEASHAFDWPELFEIMQFTGLHDQNGKEVWEGDIVSIKFKDYSGKNIKVNADVFWNENGAWDYDKSGNLEAYTSGELYNLTFPFDFDEDITFEVIGNIYENPELVKI